MVEKTEALTTLCRNTSPNVKPIAPRHLDGQWKSAWRGPSLRFFHADRQKAYAILSTSNVNWTLGRVPFIEYTDVRGEIIGDLEDCLGNKISATDIAIFMVKQLSDNQYIQKSPFIANV